MSCSADSVCWWRAVACWPLPAGAWLHCWSWSFPRISTWPWPMSKFMGFRRSRGWLGHVFLCNLFSLWQFCGRRRLGPRAQRAAALDPTSTLLSISMKKAPLFFHRPPSVGVHLLSDPFPEHLLPPSAFTAENTERTSTKRATKPTQTRKAR